MRLIGINLYCLLITITTLQAVAPDTLWTQSYNLPGAVSFQGITFRNGTYRTVGTCSPETTRRGWIADISTNGEIQSEHFLGDELLNNFNTLTNTPTGETVCGGTAYTSETGYDAWLVRLSANDSVVVDTVYAQPNYQGIERIAAYGNDIIAVGSVRSDTLTTYDGWISRVSQTGEILWSRTIGGVGNDIFYDVCVLSDGRVCAVGDYSQENGFTDVWLVICDSGGNPAQETWFGEDDTDQALSVTSNASDEIVIFGSTREPSYGSNDFLAIKTDPEGQLLWSRHYGGAYMDIGKDILWVPGTGYLLTGTMTESDIEPADPVFILIDEEGEPIWTRRTGTGSPDIMRSVATDPAGGWIAAGYTFHGDISEGNPYLIRLSDVFADFSAGITSGNAPLSVQFHDLSLPTEHRCAYDFENDGIIDSEDPDPSHTYTEPGTYTVSLTVTSALENRTETKFSYIHVRENTPPTLLGYLPTDLNPRCGVGTTMLFSIDARDEEDALHYRWRIDGEAIGSDSPSWSRIFTQEGVFDIGVTIVAGTDTLSVGWLLTVETEAMQDGTTNGIVRVSFPLPDDPGLALFLPYPLTVRVDIYDIRGRKVQSLAPGFLERGQHYLHWNGRDRIGATVGSGVYLYRIRAGAKSLIRQRVLSK